VIPLHLLSAALFGWLELRMAILFPEELDDVALLPARIAPGNSTPPNV
jgi:hypothetical protein